MYKKENLVTRKDGSDVYVCDKCGHRFISYGFMQSQKCNKCGDNGIILDGHEVWSVWLTRIPKNKEEEKKILSESVCGKCRGPMFVIPKTGHPNSKYWRFQRVEGELLVGCTNGCPQDEYE